MLGVGQMSAEPHVVSSFLPMGEGSGGDFQVLMLRVNKPEQYFFRYWAQIQDFGRLDSELHPQAEHFEVLTSLLLNTVKCTSTVCCHKSVLLTGRLPLPKH